MVLNLERKRSGFPLQGLLSPAIDVAQSCSQQNVSFSKSASQQRFPCRNQSGACHERDRRRPLSFASAFQTARHTIRPRKRLLLGDDAAETTPVFTHAASLGV